MQPILEKENRKFTPIKLQLKIDLVLHPAQKEELDKFVYIIENFFSFLLVIL